MASDRVRIGGRGASVAGDGARSRDVPDRVHWRRMLIIWLIEMAIAEPCIYYLIGPHIPPGTMTSAANGDQWDAIVATMVANGPVFAVLLYFTYALVQWRHRPNTPITDGPAIRQSLRVQAMWVVMVLGVVIGLFVFGTWELIIPNGAGGGEGPSPIWGPNAKTTHVLPVQVIGQQWMWTYRYPTYGGFETTQLLLPVDTNIAFHVTSLDVIHDWWSYQLGVKADANPGVDNVAFAFTGHTGRFVNRCDELCGIWHGAMYDYGYVVSKAAFKKWATKMERKLRPVTKLLPKFAWQYFPSANTATGGFYPTKDVFYKMFEYEYGTSGAEGILPGVHVKAFSTHKTTPNTREEPKACPGRPTCTPGKTSKKAKGP